MSGKNEIKVGSKVRIKKGACGEGYTFTVTSIELDPDERPQVYGPNYGPVWGSEVELVSPASEMMMPTTTAPANLDELLQAIRAGRYSDRDMTRLPTFGGEPPADTSGVWSWDEARLLTQTASGDLRIVPRTSLTDE